MRLFLIVSVCVFATSALACDKLVVNCTPEALAYDSAQKGPVTSDPLLTSPGKREALVKTTPNS